MVVEGDDALDFREPSDGEMEKLDDELTSLAFRYANENAVLRAEDWTQGDTLASFCSAVVSGSAADPLTKPVEPRASMSLLATANMAKGGWQNLLAAKAAVTLANSPRSATRSCLLPDEVEA